MIISNETIDDIRKSANIVDVIGHYIPITKKGKSYVAVCPFHDDHDPSLSISEDKQIYKCFVCGNGGNCFTFVQNYKKVSFIEAVIEVAKIIGKPLNIEYNKTKKVDKNKDKYDLLNDYIEYTNYILTSTKLGLEAKSYLEKRGIDEKIINDFSIGYCPEKNEAYKSLKAKGYSDEAIINLNLGRLNENGVNDVFYKRITFPIHDKNGNPIAFTARDFTNFSDSKYINSAETVIYRKGDTLFNYHRLKENNLKFDKVLVCEGVMDVLAYYRCDIKNVVATLGTACSNNQINLLKNLNKIIVLSYDGDNAGKAANIKVGALLLQNGIRVEVVDNDTKLDPDEIITNYGKNALKDLSNKTINYIDYAIKYYKDYYNLNNFNDRKEMTDKISVLINYLSDNDEKENYLNELYEITKIRKRLVENNNKKEYHYIDKKVKDFTIDGLTMAEYTILSMMAVSKEAKDIYQKDLGYLLDENNAYLANFIIDEYRKLGACQLAKLYDDIDDNNIKSIIVNLGTIETLPNEYDKDVFNGSIERIKKEIKRRKLSDLKKEINKFKDIDQLKTNEYLKEYTALIKELGEN